MGFPSPSAGTLLSPGRVVPNHPEPERAVLADEARLAEFECAGCRVLTLPLGAEGWIVAQPNVFVSDEETMRDDELLSNKVWREKSMQPEQQHSTSHLFTLRLWREQLYDDSSEVRCQVRHVKSGETRHFRDWSQLTEYLKNKFDELDPQLQ